MTSASPIVGRGRERAQLRQILDDAMAGQGALVLISGEAGIGKTTLVNDLVADVRDQGALVLTGGCYDLTTIPPYGPWVDAMRDYPPNGSGLPGLPNQLREGVDRDWPASQAELFDLVLTFLGSVTASRPLVILLEDLHWSDPASLELLRFVGRQLSHLAMLILVTYRDDEITRRHPLYQLLPLIAREAGAERIDLDRLGLKDLCELVEVRYALPPADNDRLAAYVLERAEGNPLFVTELLRSTERAGALARRGKSWELDSLSGIETPPLLIQMIDRHLATLDPAAREALEVAAIVGQDVPLETWKAVSGFDEEALDTIIAEALALHVLTERPERPHLRFTHALVREALYTGLTSARRRTWHRRAAETLAEMARADPDTVAYHFLQVDDPRAVAWLVRAGVRAERRYALVMAARNYDAASVLIEDDATQARLRGWLMMRAGLLLRYADARQALMHLENAGAIGSTIGDDLLTAYSLVSRGLLHCFSRELPRGVAEMEAGITLVDRLSADDWTRTETPLDRFIDDAFPDQHRLPGGMTMPGMLPGVNPRKNVAVLWISGVGRFVEATAMGEDFVAQVTAQATSNPLVQDYCHDAYNALGLAAAELGNPDAAWRWYSLALDAQQARGHRMQIAIVMLSKLRLVHLPYRADHLAERARLLEDITEAVTRAGSALGIDVHLALGIVHLRTDILEGRWRRARETTLAAAAPSPPFRWKVLAMSDWATLARHQGEPDEAWRHVFGLIPDGLDAAWGSQLFEHTVEAQRLAVELSLDDGDLEKARAWLAMHARWLELSGAVLGRSEACLLRARYHQVAGDPIKARELAARALEHASDPRQPLALIAAHRFLGRLELDDRNDDAAAMHLQVSFDLATACAAPFERAQTLLARAELAARISEPGEAQRLFREVRAVCEPLGAKLVLRQTDDVARHLRHAVTAYPAGLSGREVEVLEHAAAGLTNAEIGEALFISPRTVAQHLRSVYNKLGVNSRAAAVARWAELNSS